MCISASRVFLLCEADRDVSLHTSLEFVAVIKKIEKSQTAPQTTVTQIMRVFKLFWFEKLSMKMLPKQVVIFRELLTCLKPILS